MVSSWNILGAGSNVILPGSRTESGLYTELQAFQACPIPEAPEFVRLIRQAQRAARPDRSHQSLPPGGDSSRVSARQRWRLFHNRVFRSFWTRKGKAADTSDSAYEFQLAKACFCCGLDQGQTTAVILT